MLVRTPETARLSQVLAAPGVTVVNDGTNLLRVSGVTAEQIGTAAWREHVPVFELTPAHASLEEAFMQVTKDSVEYHAGATQRRDERRHGDQARACSGHRSGTSYPATRRPRGVDQAPGAALDPVVRAERDRADRRPGCRDRRLGRALSCPAGNPAATGVSAALLGVLFAQLVVGVVGVLAFSGEYGTGMIRATLAVVPARLPVLFLSEGTVKIHVGRILAKFGLRDRVQAVVLAYESGLISPGPPPPSTPAPPGTPASPDRGIS